MSEIRKQSGANIKKVSLRNLYLDPNNFRLIHEPSQVNVTDEKVKDKDVMNRTYRLLLGDKNQNILDLIESFRANGYLPVDQIQVRELEGDGYVVVEGNRRVAALKFLSNEYNQKSIDLGVLDKDIFNRVPVVIYENPSEVHHLTLMALKHISGNRKWGEWNQAKLLEIMILKHKLSEEDVCGRIGISKMELRTNIRALGLANQYQASDYGDQFSESMFPIFREAIRSTVLKKWLGWDELTNTASNMDNKELFFSWLSRESMEEDSDFSRRGYECQEPAIFTRDDVRILSKIIPDTVALEHFIKNRNLSEAYRASDLVFKEKIDDTISSVVSAIDVLSKLVINPEQLPALEAAFGKFRSIIEKTRSGNLKGVEQTSVFYDRIDKHFSSIKVLSYRSLNGIEINKLARLNIFAGVNNSGKTSFLEALYLLCRQNDFNGLVDVLRRRAKIPENNISTRWLSEQLNDMISIEGVFDNKKSHIEINISNEENSFFDRTRYLKSVEVTTQFEKYKQESITRIYQGQDRETQAEAIKLLCKAVFSSPFFFNESHHYTRFYHKSVQSKSLPRILQFIREKIVPTLQDIRLVDDFQRFLVTDDLFESSFDLTSYGEGLQRIFFTSLLFASAENGVVLIDEFENAIHADLINTFVPFVCSLAREFNVQVFVTTHSKECVDAFAKTTAKDAMSDISFHAFVRDDTAKTKVREFSGKEFARLIEAAGVDLRRAK